MFFDILTLFPEMFSGPLKESILGKARDKKIIEIKTIDIRDFTEDKHNTADDYPYGGGEGMVLKVEPIYRAIMDRIEKRGKNTPVILLSPQGQKLTQNKVKDLSSSRGLILLCGHYEGLDERIRKNLVTEEISIGDYVLTGGELPAMVIVDAVSRLLPGVLGDENSPRKDSFYNGLLDYPHYTRPRSFRGMDVPEVLLSGNHGRIKRWRKKQSLKRTLNRRPDLIANRELAPEERQLMAEILEESAGENHE